MRIAQFVQAFGDNGVTGSICDGSYNAAFTLIPAPARLELRARAAVERAHRRAP